jgi:dihydroorotate dehydrogenase/ferredoxin
MSLETLFAGLRLRSPVIVASGPASHLPGQAVGAEACGAGAVVLQTAVSDTFETMRRWPRPRYRLLDWDGRAAGKSRQFTFYSYEQGYHGDLGDYAELIRACKRDCGVPIIASIFAGPPQEWADMAAQCEAAGADALELDISSPHRPGSLEFERDFVAAIHASIEAVSFPVFAKLPPGPDVVAQAKAAEDLGCAAVCLCNRLSGVDIDTQSARPILHGGFGGLGGDWAKYYVLRYVMQAAQAVGIPISASGGVTSAEDAIKYLLAGATTVQVLTAIMLNSFGIITQINEGIQDYLPHKGFGGVEQMRGAALRNLTAEDDIVRWPWRKGSPSECAPVARVNESACTGCERCVAVCMFEALAMRGGRATVAQASCSGCGLCVEVCPAGALSLFPSPTG